MELGGVTCVLTGMTDVVVRVRLRVVLWLLLRA